MLSCVPVNSKISSTCGGLSVLPAEVKKPQNISNVDRDVYFPQRHIYRAPFTSAVVSIRMYVSYSPVRICTGVGFRQVRDHSRIFRIFGEMRRRMREIISVLIYTQFKSCQFEGFTDGQIFLHRQRWRVRVEIRLFPLHLSLTRCPLLPVLQDQEHS